MPGIKRGKDLVGWEGLLPKALPEKPKGYSSADEIAQKLGRNLSTLSSRLKILREAGKIDCMQARSEYGKTIWVYKD